MNRDGDLRRTVLLLIGDWLALGLFVFIGQIDHGLLQFPRLLAQTAVLAGPWSVVAAVLGALALRDEERMGAFLGRSLLAWLVAAPLALLLRALLTGQATIIVAFMMVTMGLGGLFLLGWRTAFFVGVRRRRRQKQARA